MTTVASTIPRTQTTGAAMGFLGKLFGMESDDASKRTVEEGQICAKCGQPVPRDNMAFDSGGGRPIHRACPDPAEPPPTP